jgi:N-acetylglucosaminyldiphosphoundecaprenol N-acetyl-beta-D-mannosaminyltransferase
MSEIEVKNKSNEIERKRIRVVSLLPDVCSLQKIIAKIADLIEKGNGGYVCFSTVHMVMEAFDNAEFARKVNGADFIVTDGMPLVWMQKLQGAKDAERVRANDLMISLCEYAEKNNLKVGFYGGKQEVVDGILKRAERDFPNLEISYAFSPPFRPLTQAEDAEIVENIKNSETQILFMGLGCPKQENWMAAHRDKFPAIMLGVGASFDFYAGNIRESPELLGKLGLEWLYRLTQEPKRLWKRYVILNPRFMFLAVLQLLGLKKFENKS